MKRKTVSLCMIARDEEASIGLAIKSVLALVDEVIVVDTGSRDNTRIIAEGYGARIVDMQWQDDFAAARNVALGEATCDWILVLDADEKLQPVRPVEFQRMLGDEEVGGYRIGIVSAHATRSTGVAASRIRLFRNSPAVRYRHPIFERVQPSLEVWCRAQGRVLRDSDISILHDGGDNDADAAKRDRNLRILKRAIIDYPEEPYFEYRLANEALTWLDEEILPVAGLNGARCNLERAWHKVLAMPEADRSRLSYGADLVARIAGCLLAVDRLEAAREIVAQGRRCYGDSLELVLQDVRAGIALLREHADRQTTTETADLLCELRRDIDFLRHGQIGDPDSPTVQRCRALYVRRCLGELAMLEGRIGDAAEIFEKALTFDNAYSFAWLGLAECARFAGDRKRALKLYLRTVTENELNHRAWLRGSSLLEELEFYDNAHSWRRKVSIHFPEYPQPAFAGTDTLQPEAPLPG